MAEVGIVQNNAKNGLNCHKLKAMKYPRIMTFRLLLLKGKNYQILYLNHVFPHGYRFPSSKPC
jgi:hypothetical protein